MIKVNCPTCGVRLTASEELLNKPVNCQKCNTKFILSRRWTSEPLVIAGDVPIGQGNLGERSTVEKPLGEPDFRSADPPSAVGPSALLATESSTESSGESYLGPSFDFTLSASSMDSTTGSGGDDSPTTLKSLPPSNQTLKGQTGNMAFAGANAAPSLPDYANQQLPSRARSTTDLRHFREAASVWQFFDFQFRGYLTPGIVRVSWFLILTVFAFWLLFLSYFYLSSVIQRKDLALPTLQNQSAELSGERDGTVLVVPRFFYNSAVYFTYTITAFVGLLWIRVLCETVMMIFCIGSHLRDKKNRKA